MVLRALRLAMKNKHWGRSLLVAGVLAFSSTLSPVARADSWVSVNPDGSITSTTIVSGPTGTANTTITSGTQVFVPVPVPVPVYGGYGPVYPQVYPQVPYVAGLGPVSPTGVPSTITSLPGPMAVYPYPYVGPMVAPGLSYGGTYYWYPTAPYQSYQGYYFPGGYYGQNRSSHNDGGAWLRYRNGSTSIGIRGGSRTTTNTTIYRGY